MLLMSKSKSILCNNKAKSKWIISHNIQHVTPNHKMTDNMKHATDERKTPNIKHVSYNPTHNIYLTSYLSATSSTKSKQKEIQIILLFEI